MPVRESAPAPEPPRATEASLVSHIDGRMVPACRANEMKDKANPIFVFRIQPLPVQADLADDEALARRLQEQLPG